VNNFQPYQNPNQSRLEQWWNEIAEMRSQNWPYTAIAKWLLDEQQLKISTEAIRQFCHLRNISKGQKIKTHIKKTAVNPSKLSQQYEEKNTERFTYKAKPIDVHKS